MPMNAISLKNDIAADLDAFANAGGDLSSHDQHVRLANIIAQRVIAEVKKMRITIPSGSIIIPSPAGPVTNASPIILNNVVT
jgi:hypothetical protein